MKKLAGIVFGLVIVVVSPALVWGRSETAREHMSVVAETVEELLTIREDQGGIGQQVSVVARAQKQSQQEIEDRLDQMEARRGWTKKLIGPNYNAIRSLKLQMEQNQLRIQQLEELKLEVNNEADATQIEAAIMVLTDQNTVLSEQVVAEEEVGSLLGWLFRLFS